VPQVLEPSDIEEILETLVSDARLECDKQLTGSGGGPAAGSTHAALSLSTPPAAPASPRSLRAQGAPTLPKGPGRTHAP
jgi:hypothetical protein